MSDDKQENESADDDKVIHRGDTLERVKSLDDVVVYGNGSELSKEYRKRVEALDEALSVRSSMLTGIKVTADEMSGVVDNFDNIEEKVNEILAKYGVKTENIDELDFSKLSDKDKKKIEKIINKEYSNVAKNLAKANEILEDDKKKNKLISKNLKKTAKEIKRYEKNHPYAKISRIKREYADALQILLLENKDEAVYKQAKKIVKEYHKLHKDGKYFSSQDIFVEPLSDNSTLGYYDGQYIHIQEPQLDKKGHLKEDPLEQGNPVAFNRAIAHEAGHKKDGEFSGANNLFFKEHVLMSENMSENLSKAAEYLYIAEQWSLCKKSGIEWLDFTNAAGWPSRVRVDEMLEQCPGLKEVIEKDGFNPESEQDVRKVVETAGKHWKNELESVYVKQGAENTKNHKDFGELLGRGFELSAKQNQYYEEVEKRMLSNVYTFYRTYDLSTYKDLLNPLSKEEALKRLPDEDKFITADMLEKINNYFDKQGIKTKDKDAYFAVALSKATNINDSADAFKSFNLNEEIVAGVKDIIDSYGYIDSVRSDLAQQVGENVVNPKAKLRNSRIDAIYQKRDENAANHQTSIQTENNGIEVIRHGREDRG